MPDLEAKDGGELRQRGRKCHCVPRIPKDHSENEASLVAQIIRNPCQCRRSRFYPWIRKIPWRRKWQPAPVFLPGEFHGQRSLVGYNLCDHRVRHKQVTLIYSENARGQSCLSVTTSGTGAIFWKERKKEKGHN